MSKTTEPMSDGASVASERKVKLPAFWRRIGLGLLAGVLLALSFPPYGVYFLLPFGIAVLLFALRDADMRSASYTGFVCGCAYFGGTLFWLANLFGAAAVSLVAIMACFPLLFAVFYVWLRKRLPVTEWLVAPVVWTACEYYRSEPFYLNFGWVGVGYGMVNASVWASVASVVGCYGVTFCIVLLSALMVAALRDTAKARWQIPALVAVWAGTLLVPKRTVEPVKPLPVRMVQAFSDDTDSLFTMSVPQATGTKPQVILWSEYSMNNDPVRDPKLNAKLRQVAKDNNAFFIFGAKDIPNPKDDDSKFFNTAYVMDAQGEVVGRHVKNHLVHFIKDGIAGKDAQAVDTPLGKLGVAICFDMDYPDVARRLVADGAEVFLVPNMDPAEWGDIQRLQHRLLFQMRSAECGRWLARTDVSGGTSVCDPVGRIVAQVNTTEPTVLDATVGRLQGQTLFVRGGWRFGPACLFLMVGGILWGFTRRRVRSTEPTLP